MDVSNVEITTHVVCLWQLLGKSHVFLEFLDFPVGSSSSRPEPSPDPTLALEASPASERSSRPGGRERRGAPPPERFPGERASSKEPGSYPESEEEGGLCSPLSPIDPSPPSSILILGIPLKPEFIMSGVLAPSVWDVESAVDLLALLLLSPRSPLPPSL